MDFWYECFELDMSLRFFGDGSYSGVGPCSSSEIFKVLNLNVSLLNSRYTFTVNNTMATTRLRKAFRYPEEDDIVDPGEGVDEEGNISST